MKYLTAEELATELGLQPDFVKSLARKRKIPVFRLGHRTIRFSPEKVKAALDKLEVRAV